MDFGGWNTRIRIRSRIHVCVCGVGIEGEREREREGTRKSIVPWVRSRSLSTLNIITFSIYTHTHTHTPPIIMPLNQIYNQRGNVPSSPPCHNPAGIGIGKLIQGLAGAVGWCPRASAEQEGGRGEIVGVKR